VPGIDAAPADEDNARIVFRAAQSGVYRIQATTFNAGVGAFMLTVREQSNPQKDQSK
jgi:hypothetical protein